MNRRGFTLVELLCTITVLSIIMIVTIPIITKQIIESRHHLYDAQLRFFEDSAKGWNTDNLFSNMPEHNHCLVVSLQVLIDTGFVEDSTKNILTKKNFQGIKQTNVGYSGVFIKIENHGANYNKFIYNAWDCTNNVCYSPDRPEQLYQSVTRGCTIYED